MTRVLDDAARQALPDGRSVLLLPDPASLPEKHRGLIRHRLLELGHVQNDRRRAAQMPVAPGTLGILCDPGHPALAQFPTDFHSNWQWFHLLMNSRALILDPLPAGFRPVVQVIDNFERVAQTRLDPRGEGRRRQTARLLDRPPRPAGPAQRPVNSCTASWAT